MAKRKVHRRVRSILGEEPVALVWCGLTDDIPKPPAEVRRSVGKVRLRGRPKWPMYVLGTVFFVVVVPFMLLDALERRLAGRSAGRSSSHSATAEAGPGRPPVFDGDWSRTAGQLLLGWYGHSRSAKRLVLLTRSDGFTVHLAVSPRRRLRPTRADDFAVYARFTGAEVRVEAERGQPRGFARFRLRFADGSWLELGHLAEPEDADRFLDTVGV
ncbi:hypothetical protein AB0J21_27205 [Streptomyces sp. NPDC049954]|uniref:hypothetical protein n=1 Tax=Streptomyces sp. NPDC049954 TaxID=3155779 RepID=UPI00341A06FC